MSRFIFVVLMLHVAAAYGQGRFGIEAGAGMPLFNVLSKNNNATSRSFVTPMLEINYMHPLNKWMSVGAKLACQRFSVDFSYNKTTSAGNNTDGVHTKSNYLFLAPTLDMGIGKKQTVHAYVSPAVGYLLSGTQTTEDIFQQGSFQSGNIYRSDDKIEKIMFRLNLGVEEHVWKNAKWHLIISEGFSVISTPVTTLPTSKTDVRPGYVYVQVGLQKLARPGKQQ